MGSSTTAPGPSKGLWDHFADLCGAVPGIGPILKFILVTIAPDRLLFLLLGVGLMLVLVYAGFIPSSQEQESAWAWLKRSLTPRQKPAAIAFKPVLQPTDWRRPYQRKLEEEGRAQKAAKPGTVDFATSDLESEELPATPPFSLVLTPVKGYDLTAEPFRTTQSGSSFLIEPLKWSKPDKGAALTVAVPRCERGDKLHIILRATYKPDASPSDLVSVFHETIQ